MDVKKNQRELDVLSRGRLQALKAESTAGGPQCPTIFPSILPHLPVAWRGSRRGNDGVAGKWPELRQKTPEPQRW